MPIGSLELHEGDWQFTGYFALVDTVHDWGRTPSEFGLCRPEDDLAVMAAFTGTVAKMRAWEAQEQERKLREQTERNKIKR